MILQEIAARVGIRSSLLSAVESQLSTGGVSQANGKSSSLGDGLEIEPSASTSRAASTMPQPSTIKVTDYLVGPQLDEALAAGQDIIVSWPFADGDVRDWIQAEALW